MKRYIVVFLAFLMAVVLCFTIAVSASEIEAQEPFGSSVEVSATATEENATEAENGGNTWAQDAKEWVGEHFAGIVTAIAALYALLPKYGGIAAVVGVLRSARAAIVSFGSYIDDKKNPNSIFNVLDRMGSMLGEFMNGTASVLERLESKLAEMDDGKIDAAKLCALMMAVEESTELMGKEFAKLLSISTTVPISIKNEMEKEFMLAQEHLHNSVKGALNNDGQKEETVA